MGDLFAKNRQVLPAHKWTRVQWWEQHLLVGGRWTYRETWTNKNGALELVAGLHDYFYAQKFDSYMLTFLS